MAISGISLRIYGGAQSTGLEKEPIVSVGSAPDGFMPMPPSVVNERQVWMITHAQTYTYYAFSTTQYAAADGTEGQLLFCLFMPAQQRLADGNSPLGLFDSLSDLFMVQALRDGKLPQGAIDASPFKMLLSRYRLEQRPMLLPVMQGGEPAAFCVSNKPQLDAIMRHSRYPVLAGVGRLELGFHCHSTVSLTADKKSAPKPQARVAAPLINETADNDAILSADDQQLLNTTTKSPEQTASDNGFKPHYKTRYSGVGGGMTLDDEPTTKPASNGKGGNGKKILLAAAAVLALLAAGFFLNRGDTPSAVDEEVALLPENADSPGDGADGESISESPASLNAGETSPSPAAEEDAAKKAAEEAAKKAAEEAKKKAAEEAAAKKAAEEAKKKAAEEAKKKAADAAVVADVSRRIPTPASAAWQNGVKNYASQCPIRLRSGVTITSINYTATAVIFTVKYSELSKYNLGDSELSDIAKDRSSVLSKYASGIPSNITKSVLMRDKADRPI